jgi:hypothetical protein
VTGNSGNHVVDGTLYFQITAAGATQETDAYTTSPAISPAFHIASGDLWFMARLR